LISFSSKNFCFSTSHEGLYSPNTFEVTLDTVEAAFVIADVAELAACRRNFVVSMPDTALPRPLLSDRFLDGALDGALELAVGELVPEPERLIPEPERLIPEPEGVCGGESPVCGMSLDGIATGWSGPRWDAPPVANNEPETS
jgi:hypothetical protein